MSYVDVCALIILLVAGYMGYRTGAMLLITEIIKWSLSAAAGILLPAYINSQSRQPILSDVYVPLCMCTFFLLSYLLLSFAQQFICRNKSTKHTVLNRITGIIPGLFMGVLVVTVSSRIVTLADDGLLATAVNKSTGFQLAAPYIRLTENYLSPRIANISADATEIPSTEINATSALKLRPDLEYEMLLLLNKERKKRGLQPLVADEPMRKVARAHAQDMLRRGYFSHVTPEGKDPFYRMKKAGITYKKAGENLAYASTLTKAHNGLMHSKLHREAILNPQFKRVGIGIADGGKNGLMIAQEFRN
jgi:uncharacterized protein YkwD